MNILAIDLGTTTGWSLSQADGIISGSISFAAGKSVNPGVRFLNFRNWLIGMFAKHQIDTVAFEMVHNHKGVYAAHIYGGFLATLETVCFEQQATIVPFGVKAIKKFITGNGNASKQDMIDAVVSLGFKPIDDNEADSIGILLLALDTHKSETVLDATNTGETLNISMHCCVTDTGDTSSDNVIDIHNVPSKTNNTKHNNEYSSINYLDEAIAQSSKDSYSEIDDTV